MEDSEFKSKLTLFFYNSCLYICSHVFQALQYFVDSGNAISICSGGVTHYGVCVGKRDGDLLISHKYAEKGSMQEKKIVPTSRGVVEIDNLIYFINPSTKTNITIHACYTNITGHMCRAAAVHKALYTEDPRYNLFYANCENFSAYCCTSFQTMSTQVFEYDYGVLGTISPFFILIASLLWGFGFIESSFFASFIYLAFYLGNPHFSIYMYLKFSKWKMNSAQSNLATIYENLDLSIQADLDYNDNELIKKETDILHLFYYYCQHINIIFGDNEEYRLKLHGHVCKFVTHYLPLKTLHIFQLTKADVENEDVRILLFKQLNHYLVDVKVFALALGEFQSNAFLSVIGCNILSIILILLRLFSFDSINGVSSSSWLKEKNQFAQGYCKDLSTLRLDFSKLNGFENYKGMFICLDIYWRLVFDSVSLGRADQCELFNTLRKKINDAKRECGNLCQNDKCVCPNVVLMQLEPLYTTDVKNNRLRKKLPAYLQTVHMIKEKEAGPK